MTLPREPVLCGPPYLNGDLHAGHCVNLVVKDFVNRYHRTVLGDPAIDYWYNFDAQGLPLEHLVRTQFPNASPEEIIDSCLKTSKLYLTKALETMKQLNLLDTDRILSTSCLNYKVKLMNYLAEAYSQGKLKKKLKHMDYCYSCEVVLANAEVEEAEEYAKAYTMGARITSGPHKNAILMFATSKPHSLVNNAALAIANKNYYKVLKSNKVLIVGDPTVLQPCELIYQVSAAQLEGNSYEILISEGPSITGKVIISQLVKTSEDVLTSEYFRRISCVHLSPYDSYLDYLVLKALRPHVNYSKKDAEVALKKVSFAKKKMDYECYGVVTLDRKIHRCWRCKNQVDVVLSQQYFLELSTESRSRMVSQLRKVALNNENYRPALIEFFSKQVDWCISRSRPFGTPLPLVKCSNDLCESEVLPYYYERTDFEQERDCYYPRLDPILKKKNSKCEKCGAILEAEKISVDVWVDSGFLPLYFQKEYKVFVEGQDQIRGWFYSTAFLCELVSRGLPYHGLVFLGWIVRGKHQKLSKSEGNYPSMKEVLNEVGILNFRSYALSKANSKQSPFSKQLILEQKKYVNVIQNIVKFLHQRKATVEFSSEVELMSYLASEPQYESYKAWTQDLNTLLEKLDRDFKKLNYSLYWDSLKNFLLKTYSRKYLNTLKPRLKESRGFEFLHFWGKRLLKYVEPVLGCDVLTQL